MRSVIDALPFKARPMREMLLPGAIEWTCVLDSDSLTFERSPERAIATFLAKKHPCKMGFVAIQDTFAESGKSDELLEKYGLTYPHIVKTAKKILGR